MGNSLCANCGKPFTPRPENVRSGYGKNCSRACGNASKSKVPAETRFWKKVEKIETGCWEWKAQLTGAGYGTFRIDLITKRRIHAHRFSYELHFGQIPDGLLVCHKCDNRRCVRPDHLFAGTQLDNMRDMISKGRDYRGTIPYERRPRGMQAKQSKLNDDKVRDIRRRYAEGGVSLRMLAEEYGVDIKTIHPAIHRRTWAHVI